MPQEIPEAVEWRFDEAQPDWSPVKPLSEELEAVRSARVDDALRLSLSAANRNPDTGRPLGSLRLELSGWKLEEWAFVEIQARTSDRMRYVGLDFNYSEEHDHDTLPFLTSGDRARLVTDGTVQTYRLSLDWPGMPRWAGPWTHLGIWFNVGEDQQAATLDILSVRVIPREEAEFEAVVLHGHEGPVYSAAFSRDGSLVVTASDDGTVRVWPASWSQSRFVLRGHQGWVTRVAYSRDGTRVVTASDDGTARVWPVDGTGEPIVLRHEQSVTDASFSPDDSRVVTASGHTAYVWHADGVGRPILLGGHEGVVRRAVFSPDGARVVTAAENGTARVWSVDGTGEPVVLRGHEDDVVDVALELAPYTVGAPVACLAHTLGRDPRRTAGFVLEHLDAAHRRARSLGFLLANNPCNLLLHTAADPIRAVSAHQLVE